MNKGSDVIVPVMSIGAAGCSREREGDRGLTDMLSQSIQESIRWSSFNANGNCCLRKATK